MRKLPPKPFIFFHTGRKISWQGGLQAEVTTLLDEIRAGKAEAKSTEQLEVSVTTVERDFRKACAYLRSRLVEDV